MRFTLIVESIFFADMLLSFITDFVDPQRPLGAPIRELSKIFAKYMKGGFMYDIIALTPFYMLRMKRQR